MLDCTCSIAKFMPSKVQKQTRAIERKMEFRSCLPAGLCYPKTVIVFFFRLYVSWHRARTTANIGVVMHALMLYAVVSNGGSGGGSATAVIVHIFLNLSFLLLISWTMTCVVKLNFNNMKKCNKLFYVCNSRKTTHIYLKAKCVACLYMGCCCSSLSLLLLRSAWVDLISDYYWILSALLNFSALNKTFAVSPLSFILNTFYFDVSVCVFMVRLKKIIYSCSSEQNGFQKY